MEKNRAFLEDTIGEVIRFFKKKAWKKKVQHKNSAVQVCLSVWIKQTAAITSEVDVQMKHLVPNLYETPVFGFQTAEFRESTTGTSQ